MNHDNLKQLNNSKMKEEETNIDCVFCSGAGIAKCFNFAYNKDLRNGTYKLNDLINKHGEHTYCPECHTKPLC